MGICENIQYLCKKKGLPISHLEKELALANGSIRRWNDSSPSADKLQKVAEYFKVSTDRLTYGFEWKLLTQLIGYIQNGRTHEQFSKDTGVDLNELSSLCMGLTLERPSLETLEKILSSNPIDRVVDRADLLEAAGYDPDELPDPPVDDIFEGRYSGILYKEKATIVKEPSTEYALSPKDERDIARDLEKMLSNLESREAMSFYDGEPLDEESKELLRISLENSMRLAKQMAKKKFTPKKYRKEE